MDTPFSPNEDPRRNEYYAPFVLSETQLSSKVIPPRIAEKIEYFYHSALKDGDVLRVQLNKNQIRLGGIAQQDELYIAAINAFCENGTFAIPLLPTAGALTVGNLQGSLMVTPDTSPLLFEHICYDCRIFRENGAQIERQIRQAGKVTVAPQFVFEYLDFLQNMSRGFGGNEQYHETLSDLVAKKAALEIALNREVLAATPNFLAISNCESETENIILRVHTHLGTPDSKITYQEILPAHAGDIVHVLSPGFNFLSEYRSLTALPHVRFHLHEPVPFIAKVLSKTASLLGMDNVTVDEGLPTKERLPDASCSLLLSQRTYSCDEDVISSLIEDSKRLLTDAGKIIIVNSLTKEPPFIPQERIDAAVQSSGLTLESSQEISQLGPRLRNINRQLLLSLDGRGLYDLMFSYPTKFDSSSNVLVASNNQ